MRLLSLPVLFLACATAAAADWPQWLGLDRDASSPDTVAPWKQPPPRLWHLPVGEGHSSPVVAGGNVFVFSRVKDKDEEELLALNAETGRKRWSTSYPRAPFTSPFGNGPRATPAVDNGNVYTFGVTGILSCFRANSGEKIWQVDTLAKFKAPNLTFGMSCSPLVEGNNVLVNVGAKGASIVAFDKETGEVRWKSLDDSASYSSPIVFGAGRDRQVVFVTQQGVVSLNPADGSLFWRYPLVDLLSESSTTPVRVGDLLVAGSVTTGSVALKLETKEGKPVATKEWKNPALTCYFSTPVPVGKELYMVTGTVIPPPEATLRCVEAGTGKELWRKPRIGKYHASMIRTGDGKLLLLDDGGNLALLDPSPSGYRALARAHVCGPSWAHPALSDGRLLVRDEKELTCLELVPFSKELGLPERDR